MTVPAADLSLVADRPGRRHDRAGKADEEVVLFVAGAIEGVEGPDAELVLDLAAGRQVPVD